MSNHKYVKKFNKQAKLYDKGRYNETLMRWRGEIIPSANGKVLEVGVGVGANFPFYNDTVEHLTAVDFSSEMIKLAVEAAKRYDVNVSFKQEDIDHLHFEPHTFDTIVSTLTVCGYEDPIKTLTYYKKWCKLDGLLLFLEHGVSDNRVLAITQKLVNPIFKQIGGCSSHRDILKLMELAGLEIIRIERFWSGIVSMIWAKPTTKGLV